MKISLIQNQISPDYDKNYKKIISNIKKVSDDTDLVVLSELHDEPYFCQSKNEQLFEKAKDIEFYISRYKDIAIEKKIYLVISVYEKAEKLFNTALVLNPQGELIHKYRKTHIPSCDEYNESFYFAAGDNLDVIKTPIGNIGVLICYDQWFPENARKLAKLGAQVIVIPTAIGFNHMDTEQVKNQELDAWLNIHKSHAIANGVFVAVCNRVGFEKGPTGIDFWGNSCIFGTFGETLSKANHLEAIVSYNLDFNNINKIRQTWPFLTQIHKMHE
jgi:N-carbamoylputrescine amidase